MAKKDTRFEVEAFSKGMMAEIKIITDSETGVQYLFFFNGTAGGLTPLLGADGKPKLADPIRPNDLCDSVYHKN